MEGVLLVSVAVGGGILLLFLLLNRVVRDKTVVSVYKTVADFLL